MCPPPVPILIQLDPVHTSTSHFLKMHLTIYASVTQVVSFPQDFSPKWNLCLINYTCTNNLFCVCILLISLSFVCLSQSQSSFQYTDPIKHTAYIYSHTHPFQYISITYVALYISSIYWHPQNLLINKFKRGTYSTIHMYVQGRVKWKP